MPVPKLFTSESVTEGHPDKIADQISDAILDDVMVRDPEGKVACETLVTTGMIFVAGEITTEAYVDIPTIARNVVKDVGYTNAEYGFDYQTCAVITSIDEQSPDIRLGVIDKQGAGDQGMMFGYACKETNVLMPMPIVLAHRMAMRLAQMRRENSSMSYLRPDGKTQATVEYDGNTPKCIHTIIVSTQHEADVKREQIEEDVRRHIVQPVLEEYKLDSSSNYRLLVNPTGRFVEGGPKADCGLTGRKIIVDTYGGVGSHGGGAFSGKDPSKVDRSASYAARHIAKNVVAAGLADACEIQIAYAIGEAEPVSIFIDTAGTGLIEDKAITKVIRDTFDLTPKGMIERLKLKRGIYRKTAVYGHFGREDEEFTWEYCDYVEELKRRVR
ncbi:MAG: methionine adenosyltransferase [Candidatus Latescibacteria bacterium]|nr:methionine adenosyltransferase [Candidatus Latescibacterota bacterium]NIM22102.1 methionine adenosyltransferase [Candidatus Latescibacterota bacterium]NIM66121.1 methionine adenosyltransferase [Candidatus Latescibacterota bacterium]NIO02529.1 methionine adenosyltransferase [Candidatus Latescibacterota bacterium]NIO29440.1 methionine adenosyltransferase [Candidatus Latescibacterota bacterium]